MTTTPTPPHKEHPQHNKKEKSKHKYRWYVPLTYILGPIDNTTDTNTTAEITTENLVTTTNSPAKNGNDKKKGDQKNQKHNDKNEDVTKKPESQKGGRNRNNTGSGSFYNPTFGNGTHLVWMNMTEGLYFYFNV